MLSHVLSVYFEPEMSCWATVGQAGFRPGGRGRSPGRASAPGVEIFVASTRPRNCRGHLEKNQEFGIPGGRLGLHEDSPGARALWPAPGDGYRLPYVPVCWSVLPGGFICWLFSVTPSSGPLGSPLLAKPSPTRQLSPRRPAEGEGFHVPSGQGEGGRYNPTRSRRSSKTAATSDMHL
jgi:hypothetical protein